MERAISIVPVESDFTIVCGHRDEEEQNRVVAQGFSRAKWPTSKHNSIPSMAVDVIPYPVDWEDYVRFYKLATYIYKAAIIEEVYNIRWGGHWTIFQDMPHWELGDE